MRCYSVKAMGKDGRIIGRRYAGTAALSREAREVLMATFGVKKKDVSIDEVEVPTAKADLLVFVNQILTKQDVPEV